MKSRGIPGVTLNGVARAKSLGQLLSEPELPKTQGHGKSLAGRVCYHCKKGKCKQCTSKTCGCQVCNGVLRHG